MNGLIEEIGNVQQSQNKIWPHVDGKPGNGFALTLSVECLGHDGLVHGVAHEAPQEDEDHNVGQCNLEFFFSHKQVTWSTYQC